MPAAATPHIHDHTVKQMLSKTATGMDFTGQTLDFSTFNTNDGKLKSVMVVENLSGFFSGNASATSSIQHRDGVRFRPLERYGRAVLAARVAAADIERGSRFAGRYRPDPSLIKPLRQARQHR